MYYSEYFKKPRFKANNQEIYYDFYEGARFFLPQGEFFVKIFDADTSTIFLTGLFARTAMASRLMCQMIMLIGKLLSRNKKKLFGNISLMPKAKMF